MATSKDPKTIVLREADNGKIAELATGGQLEVRLEAQLGTGYSWAAQKPDERVLEPMGEPTIESPKDSKPGVKERQVFRYRAKALGETTLLLEYRQPWAKDVPPARTFRVPVHVRDRQ